jgi:arylsulfatase A-like enzyme
MKSPLRSSSPIVTRILIGLAAFLGVCGAEAQSTASDTRPPNIVFILADDLGWGDISVHGGSIPTPNIDRLFEQGVEFPNFMGWTVCSPTRAMFLTGRHPFRMGLGPKVGGELDTEETTIAEAFRAQGYRTGVFGKWDNGEAPDTPEFRKAFAQAFSHKPGKNFVSGPGATAHGFDEAWVYYAGAGDHFTRVPKKKGGPVSWWHNRDYRPQDEGYTDDLITQHAREFIRDNKDQPFFCYVSFHIVHTPLQAKPADIGRVPAAITDEKQRLYGAMLLAMDDNVSQLLAELDRLHLDDNTIVVFTSDNGATLTGSNRPLRGVKHDLYEGGVRLPTAIRWPRGGLVGGQIWDGLWGFLDLFPTLVDMAGLAMPETRPLDGKNVWPAIRERGISPVGSYYWAWRRSDSIRTAEWKLHRYFNRDELYDIRNDAGEQNNLADERPEVVTALEAMMDDWVSSLGVALAHQAPPAHLNSKPAPDGEVLEVTATVSQQEQRKDSLIVPIADFAGRQVATDFIEFDICSAPGSLTSGFFYTPFRRKNKHHELEFRRGLGIDQFGREQARGPAARGGEGVWEHRIVGLLEGAPGPLPKHVMVFTGKRAGPFKIYIDNLRIRHVDGSTTPIWQDDADTRFSPLVDLPPGFSNVGVRAVQLADLKTTIDDRSTEPTAQSAGSRIWGWTRILLVLGLGTLAVVIAFRAFNPR